MKITPTKGNIVGRVIAHRNANKHHVEFDVDISDQNSVAATVQTAIAQLYPIFTTHADRTKVAEVLESGDEDFLVGDRVVLRNGSGTSMQLEDGEQVIFRDRDVVGRVDRSAH